ncbi:protein kinase domain-containing protein [Nonomuraea jabiensis]|uniref:protein kinase domain-containing protein n=1 Tax=Nonomuraea jabiensis TaxID=882448 RepID=UPI003D7199BC
MTGERFHPIGPLAQGAPGRALRVLDRRTGMEVAAKRLPQGRSDFDVVRRQAMAAGGLRHPSIHPVYEVAGVGTEVWILAPIVNGWSLRAELHQRAALGPAAAAAIGLRVLDALTYAHRHGVTHGNLHPGNVLLAPGGHVVLNDFAIPALAEETTARLPGFTAPELTTADTPPPGTTPEPAQDELAPQPADDPATQPPQPPAHDDATPDPAADLWALGAILYTAALGRPPFVRATPAATVEAVRQGIAIEAKDPFTALLRDLLDPDPARRPDAAAVHAVLQGVAARPAFEVATVTVGGVEIVGRPIPADPPASPAAPPRRSPRLKPAALVPAVAAAAVLGAGLALLVPVGTTAAPPAAASGTGPAAAPVPDDIPPFTHPPKPCTLISDDLVRELAPSAGKPFTYVKGAFTSCSWKSDYAIPEAKRGELSITLDTLDSAAMSDATFDLSKRVASRLHTNYREVDGLAHDAFTYTDTTTRGIRRYKVTYEFRLSNLHGTVEYGRSVGVDPDGSIAGNAEKVTRLVIDRLLKRPG